MRCHFSLCRQRLDKFFSFAIVGITAPRYDDVLQKERENEIQIMVANSFLFWIITLEGIVPRHGGWDHLFPQNVELSQLHINFD